MFPGTMKRLAIIGLIARPQNAFNQKVCLYAKNGLKRINNFLNKKIFELPGD